MVRQKMPPKRKVALTTLTEPVPVNPAFDPNPIFPVGIGQKSKQLWDDTITRLENQYGGPPKKRKRKTAPAVPAFDDSLVTGRTKKRTKRRTSKPKKPRKKREKKPKVYSLKKLFKEPKGRKKRAPRKKREKKPPVISLKKLFTESKKRAPRVKKEKRRVSVKELFQALQSLAQDKDLTITGNTTVGSFLKHFKLHSKRVINLV